MESTKIEVRSKPLLSPTHSLDEGFESDPDRISTDSQLVGQTPEFDVLQHTDRDGMQHTQITRRSEIDNNNNSGNNGCNEPTSIICLEGEIDSEIRTDVEAGKVVINRNSAVTTAAQLSSTTQTQLKQQQHQQQQQQHRYRRVKTRAPPPPTFGTHTFKPRSQSVESVMRYNSLSMASNASNYNHTLNNMDILTGRADVLSGRYVRVTVDPRASSRLSSINNSFITAAAPLTTSSSTSALPSSSSHHHHVHQHHHNHHHQYGLPLKASTPNSNSSNANAYNGSVRNFNRYHSHSNSHLQQTSASSQQQQQQPQYHMPVCWTQSIPRQTRRLVC